MNKISKPSVLVVDDDHLMREMLKLILQSDDYPVAGEAANGKNAIEQCAKLKPGLVMLDINMPGMSGLEALEEIHRVSPATKVMMVSADATMDSVKEAISKGAIGFVVKPLCADSVLKRVNACFGRVR